MNESNDDSANESEPNDSALPDTTESDRRQARRDDQPSDDGGSEPLAQPARPLELETVLEAIFEHFDHVACVVVSHLVSHEEPSWLRFSVFTGDVHSYGTPVEVFGPTAGVVIERSDAEPLRLPFTIMASCDGAELWNSRKQTTVYMADDNGWADPLPVETGIEYLEQKLARPDDWDVERGGTMFDAALDAIEAGMPPED